MSAEQEWPSEWLRGVLQLLVLRQLADGPSHGYAIATALTEAGYGLIKGGTLYPLLGRLEQAGLVTTQWLPGEGGPGRKSFELTLAGREQLADDARRWAHFAELTTSTLTGR